MVAGVYAARLPIRVVLDQHKRWLQPVLLWEVARQDLGGDLLNRVGHRWSVVVVRLGQNDSW